MSRELVDEIYFLVERNRKEARLRFKEAFGVDADDSYYDEELENILRRNWRADEREEIPVPARLLLAMVLRARGKGQGRKRPPKEKWARRQADLAVKIASNRWAQLFRSGIPTKPAKDQAAAEMAPRLRTEFKHAGISKTTLLSLMRRSSAS